MRPNKNNFRKCCESKRGILTKCSITEIIAATILERKVIVTFIVYNVVG